MFDAELRALERAVLEGRERPFRLERMRERLGLTTPTDHFALDKKIKSICQASGEGLGGRKRWPRAKEEIQKQIKDLVTSKDNCESCSEQYRPKSVSLNWYLCAYCKDRSKEDVMHIARGFSFRYGYSQQDDIDYYLRGFIVAEPETITLGIIAEWQGIASQNFGETMRLALRHMDSWDYSYTQWADKKAPDRVQASREVFLKWATYYGLMPEE